MDELITLKEFQERYRCSRFAVYALIKRGMPHMKPAGKYLFSVLKIEDWMEGIKDEK